MKTNFIRQIVIAFAIIVPVYPSVFAQNSNLTVDSVNNPPLSDYDLRKLDSRAISWNSEEGYWHAVNNDAATTEDCIIIPLPRLSLRYRLTIPPAPCPLLTDKLQTFRTYYCFFDKYELFTVVIHTGF